MSEEPQKREWITKAEETCTFHKEHLRNNPDWRLSDTSRELKRSIGRVSEDLLVGHWLTTHRKQLEKFKFMSDALDYIKTRKRELRLI